MSHLYQQVIFCDINYVKLLTILILDYKKLN